MFGCFYFGILGVSGLHNEKSLDRKMKSIRPRLLPLGLACILLFQLVELNAEPITVRHVEGVMLGFLLLRTLQGEPIAYGELKQVVNVKDGLQR